MANEFYVLVASAVDLAVIIASGKSNLSLEPYPTIFTEAYEEVGVLGDGKPVELGAPTSEWNWDVPLSNSEWGEIMGFTGAAASVTAYIRTRTNQVSGGKYIYANYSAVMRRPTGETRPPWRYEDVSIKFTGLVSV